MKKKYKVIALAAVLCFALSACQHNEKNVSGKESRQTEQDTEVKKVTRIEPKKPLDAKDKEENTEVKKEEKKVTRVTPEAETEQTDGTVQLENADTSEVAGEYTVKDGWVRAEAMSTSTKIFYTEEGHDMDTQPDNISVNIGKNQYAASDHISFRDAILRQLSAQIGSMDDTKGVTLNGSGTYTNQGYNLYVFTITEPGKSVTTQYYIVGDYQFCLFHETNFTGLADVDKAAEDMVNSFVWTEDK